MAANANQILIDFPHPVPAEKIRYTKAPASPVFECALHPESARQLAANVFELKPTPDEPKNTFWLQVVLDSLYAGGQLVFDTVFLKQNQSSQRDVAVRTLFQLDGDVLLKFDRNVLTGDDGFDILEAHFRWTDWCLQKIYRVLSPPGVLQYIGWSSVIAGGFTFTSGLTSIAVTGDSSLGLSLQCIGITLLTPGHQLHSPYVLRYYRWLPLFLGVLWMGLVISGAVPSVSIDAYINSLPILLGSLAGPLGGRLTRYISVKTTSLVIRRKVAKILRG